MWEQCQWDIYAKKLLVMVAATNAIKQNCMMIQRLYLLVVF